MAHLGPFRLVAHLGTGGMGEVWQAEHVSSGAAAALKLLKAEHSDARHHALFTHEIEAVARLDHPAIARILDHGRVPDGDPRFLPGTPWFAMEACRGGSLGRRAGRTSWPDVQRVLFVLLDALAHAHARGVVHRDLKPSNVLRGGERSPVVLVDFGSADTADRPQPLEAGTAGTPSYMAPEQLSGGWRRFGPWTDLYALGCLAWALRFGGSPFARDSIAATAAAHADDPLPDLPERGDDVPAEAHAWIARMVAKDPADRFASAADAARALARVPAHRHGGPAPGIAHPAAADDTALTVLTHAVVPGPWRHPTSRRTQAVPDDWRTPAPPWPSHDLAAAGLGLIRIRRVPFVGREPERDQLWAALRQAADTRSARVVWVCGPEGIGRSRLARWLGERGEELGVAVALVANHAEPPGPSDGLAAALARHLRVDGLTEREAAASLAPTAGVDGPWEARVLAASLQPEDAASPEVRLEGRAERVRVWLRAVRRLAADGPVVVLLDDVHLDPTAPALLRAALRQERDLPIVWVPTSAGGAEVASSIAADVLDDARVHCMELHALPRPDATALARAILPLGLGDAATIARRTGGHPQLAVHLVESWVHQGLVRPGPLGFELATELPVPETLAAMWDDRLHQITGTWRPAWRHALQLLAVMGGDAAAADWEARCREVQPGADPGCLEAARLGGLLRSETPGRVRIHPPALAERLEATVEAPTRAAWHRTCAAALQGPADDERRARHLLHGDRTDEALDLLLAALQRAFAGDAYDLAAAMVTLADRCVEALSLPDADVRRARLEVFRVTLDVTLRHDRADVGSLEAIARRPDLPDDVRGTAAKRVGMVWLVAGQPARAEPILREALRLLEHDPVSQAEACRYLADLATSTGRHDQAGPLLARAEAGCPPGDRRGHAMIVYSRARLAMSLGDLDAARDLLELGRQVYVSQGSRRGIAECVNELGEVARMQGNLERARAWYREAEELYRLLGTTAGVLLARANLALCDHLDGRHAEAADGFEVAMARARQSAGIGLQAGLAAGLAAALAGLDRPIPAARSLSEAEALIEAHDVVHRDLAEMLWTAARAAAPHHPDLAAAAARLARAQWVALVDPAGVARVDASGWLAEGGSDDG